MEGENIVMIFFKGVTEYSDRKVIILPRYSIPCLPLSNAVVVCYGRVHCRIQSWIPGSVLFRLTAVVYRALSKAFRSQAERVDFFGVVSSHGNDTAKGQSDAITWSALQPALDELRPATWEDVVDSAEPPKCHLQCMRQFEKLQRCGELVRARGWGGG